MSNPPPLPDDELLSAYLDGELTEQERAAIEQRLENDAAARQTLEELRQLSAAVQALPAETLGYDLKGRVLQRVANPTTTTASAPVGDDARGWRRGVIWATLAVAAMLLLMVFRNDQVENKRQVAAVDKAKQVAPQNRARESGNLKMQAPAAEKRDAPTAAAPLAAHSGAAGFSPNDERFAMDAALPESTASRGARQANLAGDLATIELPIIKLTVPSVNDKQLPVEESFEKLLAQHDVALSKRKLAAQNVSRRAPQEEQKKFAPEQAEQEQAETATAETNSYSRSTAQPVERSRSESRGGQAEARLTDESASEVTVLVEATPEQIRSILAACRAEPELFSQVDRLEAQAELPAEESRSIRSREFHARALTKKTPTKKTPAEAGRAWVLDRNHSARARGAYGGRAVGNEPEETLPGRLRVLFLLRRDNPKK